MNLESLRDFYRDGLLNDTLPFWIPATIDLKYGGYQTSLGRDGTVIHPDKPVWFQGRFAWLLATLYQTVEKRPEWLQYSRHGIDFINSRCFDEDGRMFFSLTREGQPLRKRRYIFSETFAIIAMAAYGRASGDHTFVDQALDLFRKTVQLLQEPGSLTPKTNPEIRPMKGLAIPMIMIVTAQELRKTAPLPELDQWIDHYIAEVQRDFVKPEFQCVLETVGPEGEFYDTFDGRMICPGHSIELGWFILHEAKHRGNDPELRKLGQQIVDWSWEWGWDKKFGGILYYADCKNLPCTEYWSDMKFWWPHNEAIIAMLLAWHLTGDESYLQKHATVHDWAYKHFHDKEFGEWFGYLHRDGSVATELKGNMWKGPFHLPRMQWYCWKLLEEILA